MESSRVSATPQELRKTCDHCRKRKVKCSSENPCTRCQRFGLSCRYSPARPIGRPSKRQGTPPSDLSWSSCSQDFAAVRREDLARFEGLDIPDGFNDAMTLDSLGAPMTFPTPPDELSWSEWSALDTMMTVANPLDGSSQDQILQTREEPHVSDSINEVDGGSQSNRNADSNTQCQCGELVREHMNNKINTHDLSEFTMAQRKSMELAQQILNCNGCGCLDNLPSQISGNVLLFGAIMMDTISSYQSFIRDLKQHALPSADEQFNTQIYLASKNPSGQHVEFRLERQYVWPLAKVLLRAEIDKLSRICIAFVTRQWRVHEKGHGTCLAGTTCRKPKTTQASCPADFCPRSIESTSFFNCFRTAKHLQSTIADIQKDLD
ncbi:hypothetical protein FOVSG1_006541 [Fusarium oxysporum f. sp. vasinfectum]